MKILFANLFIQTSWSFYWMQGLGFLFNLYFGFAKEKRKEIIHIHKGYFNTHPYMSGYIIGAVLRAYDSKESPEQIKKFITVSQTTLASFGDTLFWQTIRPALLIIAVILGIRFGIIGPVLFLVLYNIIHFYYRIIGFIEGYNKGFDITFHLRQQIGNWTRVFEIIGAIGAGILPIILIKDPKSLIFIPLTLIFLILLFKRLPPILILTIIFLLIIIIALVSL
ncbi:MAG: PTS system mannose/fructose/sorbose family transporter subunit IID [candidate division WOR-3 bacterium]